MFKSFKSSKFIAISVVSISDTYLTDHEELDLRKITTNMSIEGYRIG